MTLPGRACVAHLAVSWLLVGCNLIPFPQGYVVFHADAFEDGVDVRVVIDESDGVQAVDRIEVLSAQRTVRVPVHPRDGDLERFFRVEGTLRDMEGRELAVTEAIGGYAEGAPREVHLWFDARCRGVGDCGPGATCDRGSCVGACYTPRLAGEVERSEPRCHAEQVCVADRCTPDDPPRVNGIAGGEYHTCVRALGVGLYCFGRNDNGELGVTGSSQGVPVAVELDSPSSVGAAGQLFTCWLDESGRRHCWGQQVNGVLGDGVVGMGVAPPTPAPDDEPRWVAIGGGFNFGCGVTVDRRLRCWGYNEFGQLAMDLPDATAVPIPTLTSDPDGWDMVSVGGHHACGIRDGSVYCWGHNASLQLGVVSPSSPVPVETACDRDGCLGGFTSLSAGGFHTCATRDDGLFCWGGNRYGQLGSGPSEENIATPQRVAPPGENPFSHVVSAGRSHTCALDTEGRLYCWGDNEYGQLGIGGAREVRVPTEVPTPGVEGDRWSSVTALERHTCAVRARDLALFCWGLNLEGQLGLGFVSQEDDPPVRLPRRVLLSQP